MPVAELSQQVEPTPRRWTKAEYHRMGELGWFHGQRVELIEGEVMVLSPQRFLHYSSTDRTAEVLRGAFGPGFWVRVQAPLDLRAASEPEPDVSVVAGSREDYQAHPTTALLLVEVSDTTLANDRRRKGSLYASAGIADYWIVNLVERRLEVYRNPVPDASYPYGHRYAMVSSLTEADSVSPLAAPQVQIAVADLLPKSA
jgi:Uma2 family endonuclease